MTVTQALVERTVDLLYTSSAASWYFLPTPTSLVWPLSVLLFFLLLSSSLFFSPGAGRPNISPCSIATSPPQFMSSASPPVPQINVLPASPPRHCSEPYSPFDSLPPTPTQGDDGYRPQHLTPPVSSPFRSSPLRSSEARNAKGLNPEQFNALLRQSREHRTSAARKDYDLRRELAIKNQRNKQMERRALFLSKLREPPSPTAVTLPKTPPESPVLFHCSLPSPGLDSPLSAFETFEQDSDHSEVSSHTRRSWVEQVDFRLPQDAAVAVIAPKPVSKATQSRAPRPKGRRPPSLEEITAHLHVAPVERAPALIPDIPHSRLPAFLKTRPSQAPHVTEQQEKPARPVTSVGRLALPIGRTPKLDCIPTPKEAAPPESPRIPLTPKLQVTTMVVPRTSSFSPCPLTESNLHAFGREHTAREMISTLKRRSTWPPGNTTRQQDTAPTNSKSVPRVTVTTPPPEPGSERRVATATAGAEGKGINMINILRRRTATASRGEAGAPSLHIDTSVQDSDRKARRHSSPAEVHAKGRAGFEHVVLSIPGGF